MKKYLLASLALALCTTQVWAGGPFDTFRGSKSGSGKVTPVATGTPERTTCNRTGTPNGTRLTLNISCASKNAPIKLSCTFSHTGGSVSGRCHESVNGVGISFYGSLANGSITGVGKTIVSSATISFTPDGMSLDSTNARVIRSLHVRF
ncbi:MAG: hypothetical protein RLZZ342_288 [Candidatus Parcubacteria bacterium]|jgi:hypothetical protein